MVAGTLADLDTTSMLRPFTKENAKERASALAYCEQSLLAIAEHQDTIDIPGLGDRTDTPLDIAAFQMTNLGYFKRDGNVLTKIL